jgi:hypothetical protein
VEESERPKVQANRPLKNWGQTFHFTPAVVVEASTYEDVIEAVKDTEKYPTPVRALGNERFFLSYIVGGGWGWLDVLVSGSIALPDLPFGIVSHLNLNLHAHTRPNPTQATSTP